MPTFISSHNELDIIVDGIKSSSRRSLRPDKLKSPETISRDEFTIVSPLLTSTKTEETLKKDESPQRPHLPMRCTMASIETLNTSEKASTNADFDFSSINLSIDDRTLLVDSDDGFVTCRRSGMHGSRFSLNETVIAKPSSLVDNFRDDFSKSFRGNSLNIVYEHEVLHQPLFQSSPLKHIPIGSTENASDIVIPITHSASKPKHHRHKYSSTMPVVGNLKRNPSLRYSNYLRNMRVHRNSIHYRGAMLNTHRYRLKASSCPNIYRNSMTTIAKEDEVSDTDLNLFFGIYFYFFTLQDVWYDDFVDIIKSIFDFSLFLQYKFGMMSLSTLFLFVWWVFIK